jgi:hypothetical protein
MTINVVQQQTVGLSPHVIYKSSDATARVAFAIIEQDNLNLPENRSPL